MYYYVLLQYVLPGTMYQYQVLVSTRYYFVLRVLCITLTMYHFVLLLICITLCSYVACTINMTINIHTNYLRGNIVFILMDELSWYCRRVWVLGQRCIYYGNLSMRLFQSPPFSVCVPQPLLTLASEKTALKIIPGGVLYYHPPVIRCLLSYHTCDTGCVVSSPPCDTFVGTFCHCTFCPQ